MSAGPTRDLALRGRRLALLGLGVENRALAAWLAQQGLGFTVCDVDTARSQAAYPWTAAAQEWRLGADYLEGLTDFDVVFRSPGLHALHPALEAARRKGVCISSQTAVFLQRCPAFIVGVTGTKGKGTTASLLASMLAAATRPHLLAGNIGTPPIGALDRLQGTEVVVLELSSFQLQGLPLSPPAAVVLRVTSDHLDVHRSRQEYVDAKGAICRHQTCDDWVLAAAGCDTAAAIAAAGGGRSYHFGPADPVPGGGADVVGDRIRWQQPGGGRDLAPVEALGLRGGHNLVNACAAAGAAFLVGLPSPAIEAGLRHFRPLPHRLEEVGHVDGTLYVNDSLATTPEAAAAAIDAYAGPGLVVIAGGSSKKADFTLLGASAARHVSALVLLGEEAPRIAAAAARQGFQGPVVPAADMQAAVAAARRLADPGGTVLLAPGCASFGLFRDYAARGEAFRQAADAVR